MWRIGRGFGWASRLISWDMTFASIRESGECETVDAGGQMADQPQTDNMSPTALAVSMISGAVVGFIIWMVTDAFVFLPVFIGVGLTIGLAWGMRNQDEDV